jgi:hypothetical protein
VSSCLGLGSCVFIQKAVISVEREKRFNVSFGRAAQTDTRSLLAMTW